METDEKRLDGRFLCADLVRLDWIWGEDNLRTEQALLEDISAQGGCVQLDEPLALGVSVMLTVGSTPFYGHVCYCTFRDDAYFIGLRFANETMWSASLVEPRHLINLQALGRQAQLQH
ncbi:MAG TPA: hypothetical protein VGM43_05750 [Bryobacteraceae bacterium]|jgi:hypothetical protein